MVESKNMVEVTKEKKLAAATRLVELPYHLEADSVFAVSPTPKLLNSKTLRLPLGNFAIFSPFLTELLFFTFAQSESVLEYQNKALASLVQKHKSKSEELQGEVQRSAAERVNLEANLAHLASKLLNVSKLVVAK